MSQVAAIIVAGGTGERFGAPGGKQLATVAGRPVLSWSLLGIAAAPEVASIVVVCHPDRVDEYVRAAIEPLALTVPVTVVAGGATRQQSVSAGLAAIDEAARVVLVHDGARPLVSAAMVSEVVDVVLRGDASGAVIGHPSVDTLKIVDDGIVTSTPDRARYWAIQTPQAFDASVLRDSYRAAGSEGFTGTDDASLVERFGGRVRVVEGPRDNMKVTLPEDLVVAEMLLERRTREGE